MIWTLRGLTGGGAYLEAHGNKRHDETPSLQYIALYNTLKQLRTYITTSGNPRTYRKHHKKHVITNHDKKIVIFCDKSWCQTLVLKHCLGLEPGRRLGPASELPLGHELDAALGTPAGWDAWLTVRGTMWNGGWLLDFSGWSKWLVGGLMT